MNRFFNQINVFNKTFFTKSTTIVAILLVSTLLLSKPLVSQERLVKVDFESNSFVNQPSIPFDQPFIIQGEVGKEVEYVQVIIRNAGSEWDLHKFSWNRMPPNPTETFNIVVPPVLVSNSKYDFEIITYTRLSLGQKTKLVENLRDRVAFYLNNNFIYDGKNVSINNPKTVYKGLKKLIDEAMLYQISKNEVTYTAPTTLVLEELEKQSDFRFKKVMRGTKNIERNDLANQMIAEKVNLLTDMVISELIPFINTDLVQHYRVAKIVSVRTDKERFTLPINLGMYVWNKAATDINDVKIRNTNFTLGAGVTVPFRNKSKFASRNKFLDSFGISAGVLVSPVKDGNGVEFVTPGVNLPVYTALGFRLFKVVRFNAGVLVIGEKGHQDFKNLTVIPTAGLALELDLWLGVKK